MRRKDFIFNSAAGLIGALYIPEYLQKQEIVLGHNNKRYRINTRWSRADVSQYPVNDCHEMVQDSKGRIFLLTNETKNNVMIYDKNGQIAGRLGTVNTREHMGLHCLMKTGMMYCLSVIINGTR